MTLVTEEHSYVQKEETHQTAPEASRRSSCLNVPFCSVCRRWDRGASCHLLARPGLCLPRVPDPFGWLGTRHGTLPCWLLRVFVPLRSRTSGSRGSRSLESHYQAL